MTLYFSMLITPTTGLYDIENKSYFILCFKTDLGTCALQNKKSQFTQKINNSAKHVGTYYNYL